MRYTLKLKRSLTHPNDGDIKPNTKDCNKCNGEEKSVDRVIGWGNGGHPLNQQIAEEFLFWFSIHMAVGHTVSVCGANIRPNPFKGRGSCYEAET
jgi:hypothetical protein